MTDYFEEKVINGVLSWRFSANGVWNKYTAEQLTCKYTELYQGIDEIIENNVAAYVSDIEKLKNFIEKLENHIDAYLNKIKYLEKVLFNGRDSDKKTDLVGDGIANDTTSILLLNAKKDDKNGD